ncbi:hypothetical protein [uncultured Methanobacterium sp.]|uniref:hypothetical protein n=1 Tax=uncultured Methanobacterium sp. TaxID=176306 RepID=UPI003748C974
MKYLICEICGGYYPLENGESISDFDSCQCGGKLYIVEEEGETEIQYPRITCKNCGNTTTDETAFCSSCGQILIPAKEVSGTNRSETFKPIGIFAGVTFIVVVSIVLLGLLI